MCKQPALLVSGSHHWVHEATRKASPEDFHQQADTSLAVRERAEAHKEAPAGPFR